MTDSNLAPPYKFTSPVRLKPGSVCELLDAIEGSYIKTERCVDLLNKAKQGDCWCGVGIGTPYMGGHTPQCEEIQAFVKEHEVKA